MQRLLLPLLIGILVAGCGPSAGKISGATKTELKQACQALQRSQWDYWQLGMSASAGGRLLEVAADIHTAHPGPAKTEKYCKKQLE